MAPRPHTIGLRVYVKPLLPGDGMHLDIQKILQSGKRTLVRRLRGKLLQQTMFSPAAQKTLAKSIQVKIKPSSLQVISNHPAFKPLVKGQKKEQMTWLTKARAPIPIILDSGKLIFRNATIASMSRGGWWHPGRNPTDYIDKAKKLTREFMRTKIMKEAEKHVLLMMRQANKVAGKRL